MRYQFLNEDWDVLQEGARFHDFEKIAKEQGRKSWWIYDTETRQKTFRKEALPIIGKLINGEAASQGWYKSLQPKGKIEQLRRKIDAMIALLEEKNNNNAV